MAKRQPGITINLGGGFLGLLTLVFVCLKLTGQIAWSWWWVFSPFWIPLAIFLAVVLAIFALAAVLDATAGLRGAGR